jgi:predicted nucleic acid-binding protein
VIEGMRQGYDDAYRLEDFFRVEDWIPQEIDLETLATDLREAHLDAGERDTLGLAFALSDALVLMDESAGRAIARRHGVQVRGSLGVLVEAHQRGLIGSEQLRASFAEMARREDIWVSHALVERLLGEIFADQM